LPSWRRLRRIFVFTHDGSNTRGILFNGDATTNVNTSLVLQTNVTGSRQLSP